MEGEVVRQPSPSSALKVNIFLEYFRLYMFLLYDCCWYHEYLKQGKKNM